MRFAIFNEIFQGWDFELACEFAKQAGYDAIEVAPFTFGSLVTEITRAKRAEIRGAVGRAGIEVSGIHWVLAHTEGFHVNHPDPAVRRRTSDYLRAAVEFCAELGGRSMIFGSPQRREILPGVQPLDAVQWTRETFMEAIRAAEGLGVTICMEPLAPSETNFLNTAEEALALTEPVGSRAFQIMLDVKAMCSELKPVETVIAECRGRFAYFHANDRNLKGPGFGDVDYGPIVTALRSAGYDGTVSVEVFRFEEGPEVIAQRSREYLRQKFGM